MPKSTAIASFKSHLTGLGDPEPMHVPDSLTLYQAGRGMGKLSPFQSLMADLAWYGQNADHGTVLLQTVANGLCQVYGCDLVVLSQRGANHQEQVAAVSETKAMPLDQNTLSWPWEFSPLLRMEQAQYITRPSLQQLPLGLCPTPMRDGFVVPLLAQGRIWGHIFGLRRSIWVPWADKILPQLEAVGLQLMVGMQLTELRQQIGYEQEHHQRLERLLQHTQLRDPLTGLPNRRQFLQDLAQAMQSAAEPDALAVVLLNIDHFQAVNESLGHRIGDQLLLEMSYRLKTHLSSHHIIAHWGGDKFAILLREIATPDEVDAIAEQLRSILDPLFDCQPAEVFLTACMGIALGHSRHHGPEDMVQEAEIALHQAKGLGKGQILQFQVVMHDQVVTRLQLETALHKALQNNEFYLDYQPITNLTDGTLAGFEALVRWQHPTLGIISPMEFIPLAEEIGLIVAIDNWCLQAACQQIQQWQTQWPNLPALTLSVNLSSRHFAQPNLVQYIQSCLTNFGIDPTRLKLEITETTLIENTDLATTILAKLRNLGIQISLDDFGTGYSSLNYLHQFKLDTLKIDQSFIALLELGTEKTAIVQAIITLAHALGMDVIAEGVETEKQKSILLSMNCQYGQGFLFSKPLASNDVQNLIEDLALSRSC